MSKFYFTFLFFGLMQAFIVNASGSDENFRVTEVSSPVDASEKFLIIESVDSLLLTSLRELLLSEYSEVVDVNQPSESGLNSVLVVTRRKKFIDKSKTTQDCLLGVGLCAGGIVFVQATGEDIDDTNTYNGFNAYVGNKVVTGGNACFVGIMWLTGIVYGVKGVIEIFAKDDKPYYGRLNQWRTDDLLELTTLAKLDERNFSIENNSMLARKLIPYILAKTWV